MLINNTCLYKTCVFPSVVKEPPPESTFYKQKQIGNHKISINKQGVVL